MDRAQRLRQVAKRLRRQSREAKTKNDRDVRADAAAMADELAADHDRAMVKWDVQQDPAVMEFHRRRVGNALADQEIRAALRKEEQVEPVEHVSPAQMVLSRTDDERLRENAWGDDEPREGWIA